MTNITVISRFREPELITLQNGGSVDTIHAVGSLSLLSVCLYNFDRRKEMLTRVVSCHLLAFIISPVPHGAMGCGQKGFKLIWRCHQLLSGFLAKGHLRRVSRQSRRSLMIRVINQVGVALFPSFYHLFISLFRFSFYINKVNCILNWVSNPEPLAFQTPVPGQVRVCIEVSYDNQTWVTWQHYCHLLWT